MNNDNETEKVKELFKQSINDLGKNYDDVCDSLKDNTLREDTYIFLNGLLIGIYVGLLGSVDDMPDEITLLEVIG